MAAEGLPGRPSAGTERLTRNLGYSWAGQLVFIVAGFVMPRTVDHTLGQAGLGVWDFGWSIVSYFGLAQLGIDASVNKHVAEHRAAGDVPGLRRTASSVLAVQLVVALLVFVLAGLASWAVPWLIKTDLAALIGEARYVVFCLGSCMALQIAFNTFGGVITGCHRWDLHNLLESGSYAVIVILMQAALWLGYGLRGMATVYLVGVLLTEILRTVVAHRVCEGLEVRPGHVSREAALRMSAFGGKVFVGAIAGRLLYQTNNVILAKMMGPASLALYARALALVMIVGTFVGKLAGMLTPIASQMGASGEQSQLRELLIRTSRYCAYLALPPLVFLAISGGSVLKLWMGPDYAAAAPVLTVLAFGHLLTYVHRPMWSILIGIDKHGRSALASLVAAVASVVICLATVKFGGMGLLGAAWAIALPLSLSSGLYIPAYGCGRLGLPLARYFRETWSGPLMAVTPLVLCLFLLPALLPEPAGLLLGMFIGGVLLAVVYWQRVVPSNVKVRIRRRLGWPGTGDLAEGSEA